MPEVKYLGKLREIAGVSKEQVEPDKLGQILKRLSEEHRPNLGELLFPGGNATELSNDIHMLVNGRNISFLEGLDTDLKPEDRITILYHGARGFPGG